MKHRFSIALAALLLFLAPVALHAGEHVIVCGGVSLMQWEKYKAQPHDKWWLNFIRASRIRIQEIQAQHGPQADIAWLVYRPAYNRRVREEPEPMFSIIESVRQQYGVRLVYFSKGREVINYLNRGRPRSTVKVQSFDYFGHSNRACFMFDYSNYIDSASKAWLHEKDLGQISRGVFARNAEVVSYGCHTGESMSKKWRAATGVRMRGAVGKTQYQTHMLPTLSSAGGKWVD